MKVINIVDYLNCDNFTTKSELIIKTGLNERAIRHKVSKLKETRAVIYNSQQKGYRLAKDIDNSSIEELEKEATLIRHSINDIESRKKEMNKAEKTYITYLKDIEIKKKIEENKNHIPIINEEGDMLCMID